MGILSRRSLLKPALVSSRWLADAIKNPGKINMRILDGSWHRNLTKRNAKQEFITKHIPSAQFFDIAECCDKFTDVKYMLPAPAVFEEYAGGLGIDRDTHIIVYDNYETGSNSVLTAPRVWWTFKIFGHDAVSILDGGTRKWINDGFPLTDEVSAVTCRRFEANFRSNLVRKFEDIERDLHTKECQVLDAREKGYFDGTAHDPKTGMVGHIKGTRNLPFASFVNNATNTYKSPDEIKKVFAEYRVDVDKPIVATCGGGISACAIAFAAFLCGKEDVPVYDGSWAEWYLRAKPDQMIL